MPSSDIPPRIPKIYLDVPSSVTFYPTREMSEKTEEPRTILTISTQDHLSPTLIDPLTPAEKAFVFASSTNLDIFWVVGMLLDYKWGSTDPITPEEIGRARTLRLEPTATPQTILFSISKKSLIPPKFREEGLSALGEKDLFLLLSLENYIALTRSYLIQAKEAAENMLPRKECAIKKHKKESLRRIEAGINLTHAQPRNIGPPICYTL